MSEQDTNPNPQTPPASDAASPMEDAVDAVASSVNAAGDAMAGALMSEAESAVKDANGSVGGGGASPVRLPDFGGAGKRADAPGGLDFLSDVSLNVKIELGRTRMLVEDVLRLTSGAVVELDKLAGDPVDIYVNERRVARGEVLVLNDNFCVRVSEIIAAPGDELEPRR